MKPSEIIRAALAHQEARNLNHGNHYFCNFIRNSCRHLGNAEGRSRTCHLIEQAIYIEAGEDMTWADLALIKDWLMHSQVYDRNPGTIFHAKRKAWLLVLADRLEGEGQ